MAPGVGGRVFPARSNLKCRPRHLASSDGSNGMVPIRLPSHRGRRLHETREGSFKSLRPLLLLLLVGAKPRRQGRRLEAVVGTHVCDNAIRITIPMTHHIQELSDALDVDAGARGAVSVIPSTLLVRATTISFLPI